MELQFCKYFLHYFSAEIDTGEKGRDFCIKYVIEECAILWCHANKGGYSHFVCPGIPIGAFSRTKEMYFPTDGCLDYAKLRISKVKAPKEVDDRTVRADLIKEVQLMREERK